MIIRYHTNTNNDCDNKNDDNANDNDDNNNNNDNNDNNDNNEWGLGWSCVVPGGGAGDRRGGLPGRDHPAKKNIKTKFKKQETTHKKHQHMIDNSKQKVTHNNEQ